MRNVIIKRCIIYLVSLNVLAFVAAFLNEMEIGTLFGGLGISVILLAICVILFDVSRLIKDRGIRKKYLIYLSVFIGQVIVITLIWEIFDLDSYNNWLELIPPNLIVLTMVTIILDVARSIKNAPAFVPRLIRCAAIFLVVILIVANIATLVGIYG